MSTLTQLRADLAQTVGDAVDVPVFDYWPNNVTAPCAVVQLGAGTQNKRGRWAADWRITLVGPAGDNQAAAEWVETMTMQTVHAVSERFIAPCNWERPTATPYASGTYYVAVVTVSLDIEPATAVPI